MGRGVLFVHNNFPGQFRDLALELMRRGVPCAAIGQENARGLPGLQLVRYGLPRGTTPGIFPLAIRYEADLIRARQAYEAAKTLKAAGFDPAAIVAHPGWGETLFLHEVFPDARQVAFAEFYYRGRGLDVGFDPEFLPADEEGVLRVDAKNGAMAMAFGRASAIVSPTPFQAGTLPPQDAARARVFHEGVDVEAIRPGPAEPFVLDDGRVLQPGTPVITHVNNNMEPLRGLHILARALPRLLQAVPDAHVVIIGQPTQRAYGGSPPDGRTWKEVCFDGVAFDPARVSFLGRVPHERMLAALRISTAHVYYTYPFVLSWSLSEAMASGCYVIGSDTAPVRDAITDGVNGRLLPFFDVAALSDALIAACRDPRAADPLRRAARETAVRMFDRNKGRAAWIELLREQGVEIA